MQEATGQTEWCSTMVIAMKGNGKNRICTDMTKLHLAVMREVYHMSTVKFFLKEVYLK